MPEPSDSTESLRRVMDLHSPSWMSMPGVAAVGLGTDCIKVYFEDEDSLVNSSIPNEIENQRIVKVVSGKFSAQDNNV